MVLEELYVVPEMEWEQLRLNKLLPYRAVLSPSPVPAFRLLNNWLLLLPHQYFSKEKSCHLVFLPHPTR